MHPQAITDKLFAQIKKKIPNAHKRGVTNSHRHTKAISWNLEVEEGFPEEVPFRFNKEKPKANV